jgi:hypothetical protein
MSGSFTLEEPNILHPNEIERGARERVAFRRFGNSRPPKVEEI